MSKYDLRIKFIKAYDEYHPDIFRFLMVKTSNTQLAQDLTQECFAKAWDYINRNPSNYPDNPRAFLYKVAYNAMRDHFRKNREVSIAQESLMDYLDQSDRGQTIRSGEAAGEGLTPGLSVSDPGIFATSDIQNLQTALGQLKPHHADLLTLKYVQDLTNTEIAEILNKPEGTVRVALHRALKELKKNLN